MRASGDQNLAPAFDPNFLSTSVLALREWRDSLFMKTFGTRHARECPWQNVITAIPASFLEGDRIQPAATAMQSASSRDIWLPSPKKFPPRKLKDFSRRCVTARVLAAEVPVRWTCTKATRCGPPLS